jgi:hypothetical protein
MMAKFNVSYDTESKEFDVMLDGKKLDNVMYVDFSQYKNHDGKMETHCSIQMAEKGDNGYSTYTNIVAAIDKSKEVDNMPGFRLVNHLSKAQIDIIKMLGK